jgi:hypothetical protein
LTILYDIVRDSPIRNGDGKRTAARNEVADTYRDTDDEVMIAGNAADPVEVNRLDIAADRRNHGATAIIETRRPIISQLPRGKRQGRMGLLGENPFDRIARLDRKLGQDGLDADRIRDVVNEVDQGRKACDGYDHAEGHGDPRNKACLSTATNRGQDKQTIDEGRQKRAEHDLIPADRMKLRSIRGPNWDEANCRVNIVIENVTPATVIMDPEIADRIARALSGPNA